MGWGSWYCNLAMGRMVWGSDFGRNKRFFSSPKHPTPTLGSTPSLIINGFQDSSQGITRPRHDVDHSPPPTAEIRNKWRHTSTSFICLPRMHTDNFTFVAYHQFQQPILYNLLQAWTMLFQLQTLYSSEYGNMPHDCQKFKSSLLCWKVQFAYRMRHPQPATCLSFRE